MNFQLLLLIAALVVPSSLIYSADQDTPVAYPESEEDEANYMGDPMIEGDIDEDTEDTDESAE